jgi:hypothetical protein
VVSSQEVELTKRSHFQLSRRSSADSLQHIAKA